MLDTGAILTENIPLRSHETKITQRIRLARRELTASPPVERLEDFDHFVAKVKRVILEPWNLTACNNTKIRIERRDMDYSITKYVIHVDSSQHFHWMFSIGCFPNNTIFKRHVDNV